MKIGRKTKRVLLVLTIITAWFTFNLIQIYTFSKKNYDTKSDVAIVLGVGTKDGELSAVFKERMNHSINLLNQGKVNFILITGGYGKNETISDSKAGKLYAMKKRIPQNKILLEQASKITFYNIHNAKKIMTENSLNTALVVSDPYHMKRSIEMCKKVGITALPSPTPSTMYRTTKVKRRFLVNQTWNYCLYVLFGQFRKVES